jgi:hypothetical protein
MKETVEERQEEKPQFHELARRFDTETQFTASIDEILRNDAFKQIVDGGEESIYLIATRLTLPPRLTLVDGKPVAPRSPMLALAIDKITGQDITGFIGTGDALAIVNNTIRWADQNSFIEIQNGGERMKVAKSLLDEAKSRIINSQEEKLVLSRELSKEPGRDLRTAIRTKYHGLVRVEYKVDPRWNDEILKISTLNPIEDDQDSPTAITLVVGETGNFCSFDISKDHKLNGTRKGAALIRDALAEIFSTGTLAA